jgi:hypothetical protein
MDDLDSFVEENKEGTLKSNSELIDEINNLDTEDPNFHYNLTKLIYLLVTKKPLVTTYARLDRRTAWSKYLRELNLPSNTLMANTIKALGKNGSRLNDAVFQLYEQNYANTRFFIHHLNSLEYEDKAPYLGVVINSISKFIFDKSIDSFEDVKNLMSLSETEILEKLSDISQKVGGLKRIGGETNTDCNFYSWIPLEFEYDREFIKNADIAYDLGGGFSTPHLSSLFEKEMISLDRIDPSIAKKNKIKIINPKDVPLEQYYNLLEKQKWQSFDVFSDSINDSYNSYFVTSFGFTTSTVAPTREKQFENENTRSFHTTFYALRTITELIAKNKQVYFFLYGRPTGRVYQNKIIAMKFINKKVEGCNFYVDVYSNKTKHNFGITKLVSL